MGYYRWAVLVVSFACTWYYMEVRTTPRAAVVKNLNISYDYIVVGAGTSGSTLAARLSEDGNSSVLVLEAGGEDEENPLYDIPRYCWYTPGTDADWKYTTVPQKYSGFSFKKKEIRWPRGRMLGGSSQLNAMLFVRGSEHDFNEWAEEGCDGWSYKDVLPYFKKYEDIDDDAFAATGYRGKGGPMKIVTETYSSLFETFLQAGREKGYDIGDYNGQNQQVFGRGQKNIIDGLRGSSARSHLRPAMGRPNLHVAVRAHVTKILFQARKAVAIEFIHDGVKRTVRTKKEIILSAGTIGSAQILMLSGIGPKKHLDEHGIPVIQNLPVGENLDDHLVMGLKMIMTKPQKIPEIKTDTLLERIKYRLTGRSVVFGLPQLGTDATAFLRVGSKWDKKYPNMQLYFISPYDTDGAYLMEALGYNDEGLKQIFSVPNDLPKGSIGFGINVSLLHAKSKGTIRLKSRDPFDHPEINPNYLKEIEDIQTVIAGIRFVQSLTSTDVFKKNGVIFGETPYPKCTKSYEFDTDEYWECFIRNMATTVFHHSSSCKMGGVNDKNSVVDPKLRVKGIQGLRVVDASIMPVGTAGNINAPCIMIAEKAADIIKGR